ncbi:cobalamin biosynthesis protein CobD [Tenacibaculum sp. SZ-18]|uniref:adenosylcobinamide-phosphate synthase CbiB n=1 Tax=Tenacibaculum sp. SZ-18 TaxID=754423 RepID=UPI000CA0E592|nr:adenosylcobinamide-phosphate synthase CbiB [Tenacibaculum sp. SZ-18]AUC15480.1 cobalamin biosynthesis protein CobD [Tenacibaculum sp. SZ-18]
MEQLMFLIPLIIAYILDLILGDPRWLPHPIRLFGNLIAFGERKLNQGQSRFSKGMLLTLILTSGTFLSFYLIEFLLKPYPIVYIIVHSIFLFYAIANKSLIEEGKAVFDELAKGITQGRKRLSWIVGRDTSQLNEQQIKKAVFETLSENLSDGVIAPLFFYIILGVPGAMLYKMVNTLDSMIGYKNERYFYFGKFAAKLDDVFNYIPSRITAIIMLFISGKMKYTLSVFKEGKKHTSPNAGYPEAALAYIIKSKFGGPNYYHGRLVQKPFIGIYDRKIEDNDFYTVSRINQFTTFFFISITGVFCYLCW